MRRRVAEKVEGQRAQGGLLKIRMTSEAERRGSTIALDSRFQSATCGSIAETQMTLDEFRKSLTATEPPPGLALAGLWWDAKGDWTRAHESAQQDEGMEGSWVHAYLHRKEGDQDNAAYWYGRAGKSVCQEPLDIEW